MCQIMTKKSTSVLTDGRFRGGTPPPPVILGKKKEKKSRKEEKPSGQAKQNRTFPLFPPSPRSGSVQTTGIQHIFIDTKLLFIDATAQ